MRQVVLSLGRAESVTLAAWCYALTIPHTITILTQWETDQSKMRIGYFKLSEKKIAKSPFKHADAVTSTQS